jgi:hypothetical protein
VERKEGDPDYTRLSRLWTYYHARAKINTIESDSGAFIRDAFKVLAERGAPREGLWPYVESRFREMPSAGKVSARHHRVLEYRSILDSSERDMQACLAEGYPFAFGFAVYRSFLSIDASGAWLPRANERIEGYHAVVCVGYDFRPDSWMGGSWIIRNSWGREWGRGGHFLVPRNFMAAEAWDCWTVRKVVR